MYQIVRYVADKPGNYSGEELPAPGTIQYTREEKTQAEQILNKLYEVYANDKNITIQKRTRYTFRCENTGHKYLFKIIKETNKKELEKIYL